MSTHQLGRHYRVLLGKFMMALQVDKWPIEDYSHFFQSLAEECPYLEHLHVSFTPPIFYLFVSIPLPVLVG
jgi:hypothetical protein